MILFLLWSWDESTAHEYRFLCYGTRTFQAASTLWMQLHPAQHFWKQERSQEGFLLLITEQFGTGGTEKKKYRRHNSIISNCWFYSFLKCHFLDGCSCFLRGAVLCQGRGCIFGGVCPCKLSPQLSPQPAHRLVMATAQTQQIFLSIRASWKHLHPGELGKATPRLLPAVPKGTFKDHALLPSFPVTPW